MDYTDLSRVRAALGMEEESNADDSLLAICITAASRAIDRRCTGVIDSDNYFELAEVAGEEIRGVVDRQGRIVCWPHKPWVQSVSALEVRRWPIQSWSALNVDTLEIDGGLIVAWGGFDRGPARLRLSYTGGLASAIDDLPADLVEAGTVLAVRFYKEARSSLADISGMAELGTLQYTKAIPVRVVEMLRPYKRMAGW